MGYMLHKLVITNRRIVDYCITVLYYYISLDYIILFITPINLEVTINYLLK